MHLRWVEAGQNAENVKQALANAEARVAEFLAIVTQGDAARTDIAAELPAMRQAEAAAAAGKLSHSYGITDEKLLAEVLNDTGLPR